MVTPTILFILFIYLEETYATLLRIYYQAKNKNVFFFNDQNSEVRRTLNSNSSNSQKKFVEGSLSLPFPCVKGSAETKENGNLVSYGSISMKKQIASLLRVMNLVKSFKEDNTPCKIDEGLFLGSAGTATNKDALKSLNITHILTVAGKLPPAHPGDFVYKIIQVIDKEDANLKQYFDECFDFIDEAKRHGGGVLVHCFAGKSRSVTVIVAYLMKTRRMSLSEALQHVKGRRPLAAPNSGFIGQLEDFEKSLQVKIESGL